MKATLVRGVNTSPYSVKDVDRNELLDVNRPAAPEKQFDLDAAMGLLRDKIALVARYFPEC